ncbi:MAG: molybdate ABC transporter permease subunit [Anaerolineales bacterium]|jgi:molybdate transport system permease protein
MLTPFWLSVRTAGLATLAAVLLGVPIAAWLARSRNPLSGILDAVVTLPLVLPPTVLGYFLLVVLGARSPLGEFLERIGLPLVFTWKGAVIAATLVALPLVVQSSKAALQNVDPNLIDVARTLGRSDREVFLTVTLPLAWRGVLAGATLALARSLGEFGATLMVAGNIPGQTQTLPIAIYDAVQKGDQRLANWMALGLAAMALILLLSIRRLGHGLAGVHRSDT